MDSSKMVYFLFSRIQETIACKAYIKEVNISYQYDDTFGNRYVRLLYEVESNELFDKLPYNEQVTIFNCSPNYTFSLSSYKRNVREVRHREMLRLIEFRNIYESLAGYAILQLEYHLLPEAIIKVQAIDLWPRVNYAEKYLYTALEKGYYRTTHNTRDEDDWQWQRLHEIAKQSKKIWLKHKVYFSITETELHQLHLINRGKVRSLVINYNIPIKIKGLKTIDEIFIYVPRLIEALKKELATEFIRSYHKTEYETLVAYLYDRYMPDEKAALVQQLQADFLRQFILQPGHILELEDKRIVVLETLFFDNKSNINVTYLIIKTNLEVSKRSRTVSIDGITYALKRQEFLNYLAHIPRRHLSLLRKWMLARKKQVNRVVFKPDLTKELTTVG